MRVEACLVLVGVCAVACGRPEAVGSTGRLTSAPAASEPSSEPGTAIAPSDDDFVERDLFAEELDGAAPLGADDPRRVSLLVRRTCGAPELPAGERFACRAALLRRMTDELAAADPDIAAARARGAADAELTPLYEARFAGLRRRVMVDLGDGSEPDELEAEARLRNTPVPTTSADEMWDESAVSMDEREAVTSVDRGAR